MFKKLKEKLQQRTALWIFRITWKGYNHVFKHVNDILPTLSEEEKSRYLLDAKRCVRSSTFEKEMQKNVRMFMGRLSFSAVTDSEMAAIRMTLLFLQEQEARLVYLAKLHDTMENQPAKQIVEAKRVINQI